MLPDTHIDHLVIAAASLQQGVDYVKQQLGVDIPAGGVHPKMGTHNHLMRLGDALFLEVIAIHPDIAAPPHPRWFGLDDPHVRHRLTQQAGLITWVANSSNIERSMHQASIDMGQPTLITRGDLSWHFGLPEDGRLLAGGLLPYLMQWHSQPHPAASMSDTGCQLVSLALHHPNIDWLTTILSSIGINDQLELHSLTGNSPPYMVATINTPTGIKHLSSVIEAGNSQA